MDFTNERRRDANLGLVCVVLYKMTANESACKSCTKFFAGRRWYGMVDRSREKPPKMIDVPSRLGGGVCVNPRLLIIYYSNKARHFRVHFTNSMTPLGLDLVNSLQLVVYQLCAILNSIRSTGVLFSWAYRYRNYCLESKKSGVAYRRLLVG